MAKSKGPQMDLSSFLDIMTCMLGILILIILLTGLDAADIKVLVPTPRENTDNDKRPVFFECRNDSLFLISIDEIKKAVDEKTEEILARVNNDEGEFLKESASTKIKLGGYLLDYSYSHVGKYALSILPDAEGYKFGNYKTELETEGWYGSIIKSIDPATQFLVFFVRPDSYEVFKKARSLAWPKNIDVSCEIMDPRNPIILGFGGRVVKPQ